jgi:branched-chain amino acid transport system permease protein
VVGSVFFVLAQSYLQDVMKLGSAVLAGVFDGIPVLSQLISPDRWMLWLGILFVLAVYHFPAGVVGRLRAQPQSDAP